jgi:hypothetical protein
MGQQQNREEVQRQMPPLHSQHLLVAQVKKARMMQGRSGKFHQ